MNRRGFLAGILKAGIAAAVLPPALTYARTWKPIGAGRIFVGVDLCGSITNCDVAQLHAWQLEEIFSETGRVIGAMENLLLAQPDYGAFRYNDVSLIDYLK